MSIPNLRAIRDWCKEKINGVEKSLVINGVQLYLDYQNGKYGVNTDPERGPDTFTPFVTSEEGSGDSGTSGTTPEQPEEPEVEEVKQIINATFFSGLSQSRVSNFYYYFDSFDLEKLTKFSINEVIVKGYTSSNFSNKQSISLVIGYKDSTGTEKEYSLFSSDVWGTILAPSTFADITGQEYDLQQLKELMQDVSEINYVYVNIPSYGTTASNLYIVDCKINISAEYKA